MNDAERYPCATCKYQGKNVLVAIFLSPGSQKCFRPQRRVDPVTGELEDDFCSVARRFSCGYEGRYHSDRENNADHPA